MVRRNQFLRSQGIEEWPDGTVASRYSFIHALIECEGEILTEMQELERRSENASPERARDARLSVRP
jgi:hypothetical protein